MATQSTERRRCTSCNRWGGQRQPGVAPDTVEFDEHNDRGLCIDGPWHGSERSSRNACGHWVKWLVLDAP